MYSISHTQLFEKANFYRSATWSDEAAEMETAKWSMLAGKWAGLEMAIKLLGEWENYQTFLTRQEN